MMIGLIVQNNPPSLGRGRVRGLESQGDAAHGGDACRGNVTNLIVTVVVGMATATIDGAIYPSALGKMLIEYIVYVGSKYDFLQDFLHGKRVVQVEIAHGIAWQRTVFVLRVVEIHTAYITCMPSSRPALKVEVYESVQDGRG